MSLNFKSTVSMAAVALSSLTFAACAKSSDNKQAAPAAPVQTAAQVIEAKQVAAKLDCPEFMGTFADVMGEKMVFSMASVQNGVMFNVGPDSFVVDGQSHAITAGPRVGSNYVASCKDAVLAVSFKAANGESNSSFEMKTMNPAGDIEIAMNDNGVSTTSRFQKVKDVVVATPETSVVPAAPTVPAEASSPAMELPATPVVDASTAPLHIPAIVDRDTHSPVDTPAQVPADTASDAGTAPPMPEPQPVVAPSQSPRASDMPDYYPDPRSNKHGFKGN